MKTQKQIRDSFFSEFPEFKTEYKRRKKHNDYTTDCRVCFCDFVDCLQKNRIISVSLANKTTL